MGFKFCVLVLLCCLGFLEVSGNLRCYSCSFSAVDTDRSCETITNDTSTVSCTLTYCTIYRQEFVDPPGQIASFQRGCEDSPDFLNHEVTDSTFRTFFRACTTDLCNIGNGIQSVVGGALSPQPVFSGSNLLVPGTAAASIAKLSLWTLLAVLLSIIYNLI